MKKRILSFLLCAVMLATALIIPTSAEGKSIDDVDLYFCYPVVGRTPVFDITDIPDDLPYGLLNDTPNGNVLWYNETDGVYMKTADKFEKDHKYRIEVKLQADEPGYYFPVYQDSQTLEYGYDTTACLNNWLADTSVIGENISDLTRLQTMMVSFTIEAMDDLYFVDDVYLDNIIVPKAGVTPSYGGLEIGYDYADEGYRLSPLTDDNHLNGIGWYDRTEKRYMRKNGETFIAGHEYEIRVLLEADLSSRFETDENGYPDVFCAVRCGRGVSSWLNGYDPSDYLYVTYNFGKAVEASDIIGHVSINDLDIPKAGEIADYTVTLGGDNYHVSYYTDYYFHNGICWSAGSTALKVNDPFPESDFYTVMIYLYCDDDTTFLTDSYGENAATVTVNGREAYCYPDGERRISVAYTFTAEEKSTHDVSGTVTSFGSAEDEITVQLCPAGYIDVAHEDRAYGLTIPFSMTEVEDGEYTMTVHKKNHKPYVQGVIVDGSDVEDMFVVLTLSGDANTDRKVNLTDVSLILKHIAKWNVELDTYASDVNNDGKVNLGDVSLILKYIAKWDIELK